MSYIPTNWKNGDVITSEKLNKLEQGVANTGGVLIVNTQMDTETHIMTLDKTWQEIYEAGFPIIKITAPQENPYLDASWVIIGEAVAPEIAEDPYVININDSQLTQLEADSPNDYPSVVISVPSSEPQHM